MMMAVLDIVHTQLHCEWLWHQHVIIDKGNALQALKAAREGGAARAGIGRLPQKRAPSNIAPRPVLGQQRLEGSSAPSSNPPAADSSAAPLDRQDPLADCTLVFPQEASAVCNGTEKGSPVLHSVQRGQEPQATLGSIVESLVAMH